ICTTVQAQSWFHNNVKAVERKPPAEWADPLAGFPADAVHVYGTACGTEEALAHASCARFEQLVCWYHRDHVPPVTSDADWSGSGPVVVYGNADTNAAWSHVVPPSAPIDVHHGRVRIGTLTVEGEDLAGWCTLERGGVLVRF